MANDLSEQNILFDLWNIRRSFLSRYSTTDNLSNKNDPVDQGPGAGDGERGLRTIDFHLQSSWENLCNKYYGLRGSELPYRHVTPREDWMYKSNGLRLDQIDIDFEALKGWLVYCKSHHIESCHTLPGYPHQISCLKVIDCQTGAIIKAPEPCQFAALSYVWGQPQNNEPSLAPRVGFLPANVPKTIRDAIQATMRLDLQYLWVDQYCINQKDRVELAEQVGIMDMVYNIATVTLIAACGKDANFGLPGVSSTPRLEQPVISFQGETSVTFDTKLEARIKSSSWWSRAWTFQEGVFSTRRLFFTETEVYFECNNTWTQECRPFDLHDFSDRSYMGSRGIYRGAFNSKLAAGLDQHLLTISRRQLTYQSDVLNTLGGIFRAFSSMPIPIRHFWGIPMEQNHIGSSYWAPSWATSSPGQTSSRGSDYLDCCFADGLSWIPEATSNRREGFPSWSWSGWLGPLRSFKTWATPGTSDVRIWLRKANGTYSKISEAVISEINLSESSGTVPYTQILRIKTRTIALTFKYFPENDFKRPTWLGKWTYPKPVYFAVTSSSSKNQYHRGTWYWPLILSATVDVDSTLHRELCEETFDCHLLSSQGSFGLVVRERGGIAERLGYIDTHKALAWKRDGSSGPVSSISTMGPKLFELVPVKVKTVLLE